MTCRRLAQTIGASLIGALVVVGGWSARPLAHDDHSHQGTATGGSDDHPHGALVQAVREATEAFGIRRSRRPSATRRCSAA